MTENELQAELSKLRSETRSARRQRRLTWLGIALTLAFPVAFAAPYVLNNNVVGDGTFSSSIASGSNAFSVATNGARVDFGAGASDYASSDGTTVTYAGAVKSTTLLIPADGYLILDSAGFAANMRYTAAGNIEFLAPVAITPSVAGVGTIGSVAKPWAGLSLDFTDDSATPGNRTVNKARGKNAVAIGASTCVITNSKVLANSQVLCTLEFADATATTILSCIPTAGSFTLTVNAAATADTKFSWTVLN